MRDWPGDAPPPALIAAWHCLAVLPTEHVPLWAAHLLADGYDGPALAELAGVGKTDLWKIDELLAPALAECGVDARLFENQAMAAAAVAFTAVAEMQSAGRADEEWVLTKVVEVVEREYDVDVLDLPLGRTYGLADEWSSAWGRTRAELRLVIRQACVDQLNARSGSGRRRW